MWISEYKGNVSPKIEKRTEGILLHNKHFIYASKAVYSPKKASINYFDNITYKGAMLVGNVDVLKLKKDDATKKMIWKDSIHYEKIVKTGNESEGCVMSCE